MGRARSGGQACLAEKAFQYGFRVLQGEFARDLVTRKRTVAAANAFGHIHDQKVFAINNAGLYLAAGSRENARVVGM